MVFQRDSESSTRAQATVVVELVPLLETGLTLHVLQQSPAKPLAKPLAILLSKTRCSPFSHFCLDCMRLENFASNSRYLPPSFASVLHFTPIFCETRTVLSTHCTVGLPNARSPPFPSSGDDEREKLDGVQKLGWRINRQEGPMPILKFRSGDERKLPS